jgi:hypothetical protein
MKSLRRKSTRVRVAMARSTPQRLSVTELRRVLSSIGHNKKIGSHYNVVLVSHDVGRHLDQTRPSLRLSY